MNENTHTMFIPQRESSVFRLYVFTRIWMRSSMKLRVSHSFFHWKFKQQDHANSHSHNPCTLIKFKYQTIKFNYEFVWRDFHWALFLASAAIAATGCVLRISLGSSELRSHILIYNFNGKLLFMFTVFSISALFPIAGEFPLSLYFWTIHTLFIIFRCETPKSITYWRRNRTNYNSICNLQFARVFPRNTIFALRIWYMHHIIKTFDSCYSFTMCVMWSHFLQLKSDWIVKAGNSKQNSAYNLVSFVYKL